jgi:hypothetical protein
MNVQDFMLGFIAGGVFMLTLFIITGRIPL